MSRKSILARIWQVLLWGGMAAAAGCAAKPAPAPVPSEPRVIQGDPYVIWTAGQEELTSRGFLLDRVDRRMGVIETFPATSKQWFECWRNDVAGEEALAESSLQTVRRQVKLQVTQVEPDQLRLECRVAVEKYDSSREIYPGYTRTYNVLGNVSGRIPLLSTSERRKDQPEEWIPLGEDPELQKTILDSIARRVEKSRL